MPLISKRSPENEALALLAAREAVVTCSQPSAGRFPSPLTLLMR